MNKIKENKSIWYKQAAFLIPFGFVLGAHLALFIIDLVGTGMRIESDFLLFLFYPEVIVFFMVLEPISAWYQYTGWSWFWLDTVFVWLTIILLAFVYGWIGIGVVNLYKWTINKIKNRVSSQP